MQDNRSTVVITGANSGLGYECALSLLRGDWNKDSNHYHVIMACRDEGRANAAIDKIKKTIGESKIKSNGDLQYMQCDLGSLASIRKFAESLIEVAKEGGIPPIKALVLNAGLQFVNGITYTEDG